MPRETLSFFGYLAFIAALIGLTFPLGSYMTRLFTGQRVWLSAGFGPLERFIYRLGGVDPESEQGWKEYAWAFISFTLAGTLVLYAQLRLQHLLPSPNMGALQTQMTPDLALNTAISFSTTSTWQAYGGESTMTYGSQMLGLCAQNFMAGAAGLAIGIAFIRGLARRRHPTLGNFWVDITRAILYILLPLSIVDGVLLMMTGVPMNWSAYTHAGTLEGAAQIISQGPVAALETIKNLGTNGGGFFGVNAAHPFETPNNVANFINLVAIAALPAALTRTFGLITKHRRDGWVLLGAMTFLFLGGLVICDRAERSGNPAVTALHVSMGNMEGKEVRFGVSGSTLAAITTSNTATGSTNSMHDSYTPAGGAVTLVDMMLGEIAYGGLGTGIYSIVLVGLLGLFLCGLMVGRTPEYLGKAITKYEIQLVVLYTLAAPILLLTLAALAVAIPQGLAGLGTNDGPHGFSEVLVAYTSSFANNGQSFGGLNANLPFYNITTALAMMAGRFALAIPALALAGAFAGQGKRAITRGTLPTDSLMFGAIIVGTAVLVTGLTFLPALALGPIVEHFRMIKGG